MKKLLRTAIIIGLSLFLAFLSAALTYSAQALPLPNFSGTMLKLQTTPTPQVEDTSEAGSTDEIMIMGGVIVLIIFAPILINRKAWRNP